MLNRFPADDVNKPKKTKCYFGNILFLYNQIEMRRAHTLSNRYKYKKTTRKTIKL